MKVQKLVFMRPYIKVFIGLFILFNVSLALVYRIPSTKLKVNVSQGIEVIDKEGVYFNLFPEVSENRHKTGAFQLDLYTDRIMLSELIPSDPHLSPWLASLNMNNYARYWHGYTVVLRPLMAIFNYSQVRLINIFLILVLSVTSTLFLARNINIKVGLAFISALICIKIFIVPLCLAFCNMFYVFYVFLFILLLLTRGKVHPLCESQRFSIYIFSLGAFTAFMDLLSTPLLPAGLIIAIACIWDYEKLHIIPAPLKLIRIFLIWGIGYVLMWFSKWILATILLNKNILIDAFHSIIFRVHGNPSWGEVDSFSALKYTLWCTLSPLGVQGIFLIAICMIVSMIALSVLGKISLNKNIYQQYKFLFSMLLIGCTPLVWVVSIANHSQIHYFFVYRIFIITSFIVFYLFLKSIIVPDEKTIRDKCTSD